MKGSARMTEIRERERQERERERERGTKTFNEGNILSGKDCGRQNMFETK